MRRMNNKELYQALLEANGRATQCLKSCEEANEYSAAMLKLVNEQKGIGNVIEEIADLQIMLEQMIYIFGLEDDVEKMRSLKLEKQELILYGKANS